MKEFTLGTKVYLDRSRKEHAKMRERLGGDGPFVICISETQGTGRQRITVKAADGSLVAYNSENFSHCPPV